MEIFLADHFRNFNDYYMLLPKSVVRLCFAVLCHWRKCSFAEITKGVATQPSQEKSQPLLPICFKEDVLAN